MTARLRRLMQEQRADVGRDRVEAAGVDDPGSAGTRLGVGGGSIASSMNNTSL